MILILSYLCHSPYNVVYMYLSFNHSSAVCALHQQVRNHRDLIHNLCSASTLHCTGLDCNTINHMELGWTSWFVCLNSVFQSNAFRWIFPHGRPAIECKRNRHRGPYSNIHPSLFRIGVNFNLRTFRLFVTERGSCCSIKDTPPPPAVNLFRKSILCRKGN